MTSIEAIITVDANGITAHLDLPSPVPPGRHAAIVVIDTPGPAVDVDAWIRTVLGSVTEDFEVPRELPLREVGDLS